MDKEIMIVRQSSLKAAVDLCVVGKIELKDVLSAAKKFENYVMEGIKC